MAPTTTDTKPSYHALVTGYGPFSRITNNPSWRTVSPLHNKTIHTESATIHVTALGPIKVSYSPVLSVVQRVHARPPLLPTSDALDAPMPEPHVSPPPEGYDFTLHLGAGPNGSLRLEQIGHKSGYRKPGVDGKEAPIISQNVSLGKESEAERFESERLGQENDVTKRETLLRGYAKGYEVFPENLHTEVDVDGLIEHLKQQGEIRVTPSTDAGHFLCDFICFGSLAESQRPLFDPTVKVFKRSKSLFMHVPYDDFEPFSIEEMTETVRQIIAWVCTKEKALAEIAV